MKKACVIGWPIGHSKSPAIHRYWLKSYGIEGTYERVPVEPEDLERFLTELGPRGYSGCNVTIPHKEAAYKLVKPADEMTARLGVVNTVFIRGGENLGTSTDGEGFIRNVTDQAPQAKLAGGRAVVLGAGGAAAAIVGALLVAGATEISVANRSAERAASLQKRFGNRVKPTGWETRSDQLGECAILVNATSLGMLGQQPLEISLDRLPGDAVVADLVYSPLETRLLKEAALRGNIAVDGLGMLLHQAVRGFELWFGRRPKVTRELYDMVARSLANGGER